MRASLLGLGAAALAPISPLSPLSSRPARAALECSDDPYSGVRACTAGIRSELIQSTAANTVQYASQWCWAACIESIFRYYGHPLSQADIVRQVYGGVVDMPASGHQLLRILNGTWVDATGRAFSVSADAYSVTVETAAQDLAADMPLLLGTQAHAVVLTALSYNLRATPYGVQSEILDAIVRDPWPGQGRRYLTAYEWYGIAFAARVRVT